MKASSLTSFPKSANASRFVRWAYFDSIVMTTDGTLIRAEEGPKVLASPPTAYIAQAMFLVAVADYTMGGYNLRHCGDF